MASIRKRGESFTITAYFGYDEQNRQIKKTTTYTPPDGVTSGKAEKLAKQYAATWEDNIRGFVSLNENCTFGKLAEWYFQDVAPSILKPNVFISHKTTIDTYVLPTLARKKLKDITPGMLDSLFHTLRTSGRVHSMKYRVKDADKYLPVGKQNAIADGAGFEVRTIWRYRNGANAKKENAERLAKYLGVNFSDMFELVAENKELSISSVLRVKNCISAILSTAVQKEIMRRNPCLNTIKMERPHLAGSYLDEQQSIALLTALNAQHDLQFKTMITMLLYTGMRVGELLGLLWENVNLEQGNIYICNTLAYVRNAPVGKKRVLQTPKTPGSIRYIPIPNSLVELLKEHKREQDARREALGSSWQGCKTVFTTLMGRYVNNAFLNDKLKLFMVKAGLPATIHLHSLRHTTASLLINSDVPAKVISEQLGHASTAITEDVYSHIFASSKVRAMQAIDLKLGAAIN